MGLWVIEQANELGAGIAPGPYSHWHLFADEPRVYITRPLFRCRANQDANHQCGARVNGGCLEAGKFVTSAGLWLLLQLETGFERLIPQPSLECHMVRLAVLGAGTGLLLLPVLAQCAEGHPAPPCNRHTCALKAA